LSQPFYEITVEATFSASHQLRGYKVELEPLHGHNFRVEVTVAARELDEIGLVMDFLKLDEMLKKILSPFDHRHLNDLSPFDRLNPSTENMARFFFELLEERLDRPGLELRRVRVWEAPTYNASYSKG
jgi:6-pyruvoyltetrahydropterin/6-carboxytetrahydropterin synthase